MESSYDLRRLPSADGVQYDPEIHCAMVMEVCSDYQMGDISFFCSKCGISNQTFFQWTYKYPEFNEAYGIATMKAKSEWLRQAVLNKDDPEWDRKFWEHIGKSRFGMGKSSKIFLALDPHGSPTDHYKQILAQGAEGAFSSAELKQLMEAINIGLRAHEIIELQKEIEQMKNDLVKMMEHTQHVTINSTAVEPIEEGNSYSLENQVCEQGNP